MALGGLGSKANQILIKIVGDSKEYKKELDKSEESTKSFASKLKSMGPALAAGFAAAATGIGAYSIQAAAEYQGLARAFNNLATEQGKDANQYIAKLKEVSHGTMSEAEIMKAANRAMLMDIPLDDIVTMLEGASVIAQATGQDFNLMFESMVMGTARESKMLLDNLGILIDVDKATENYKNTLGITGRELTDSEKKIAFMNAAMDSLGTKTQILGGYQDDAVTSMARLKAKFQDTAVLIGNELLPVTMDFLNWLYRFAEGGGVEKIVSAVKIFIDILAAAYYNIKLVIDVLLLLAGAIGHVLGVVSEADFNQLAENLKGTINDMMQNSLGFKTDITSLFGKTGKEAGTALTTNFDNSSFPKGASQLGVSDGQAYAKGLNQGVNSVNLSSVTNAVNKTTNTAVQNKTGVNIKSAAGGPTGGGGTWEKGYGGVYTFKPATSSTRSGV